MREFRKLPLILLDGIFRFSYIANNIFGGGQRWRTETRCATFIGFMVSSHKRDNICAPFFFAFSSLRRKQVSS